jgi:uncharacterized protein DUF5320
MPGGDRTGPLGQGPMTGRGMGYCAGNSASGFAGGAGGRGFRGGGRGGRGWRNQFHATGLAGWQRAGMGGYGPGGPWTDVEPAAFPGNEQLEGLKTQAGQLEETLQGIRQRIEAIEKKIEE